MEKKTLAPISVIKYSMTTSLKTFMQEIEPITREMDKKIKKLQLEQAGHSTWVYYGCDGSAEKNFRLDITLPIKEAKGDSDQFCFEQLPEYTCITAYHKGPWAELAKTYAELVPLIVKNGYQLSDINREVYILADHSNPINCLTEIQIGIK